MDFSYLIPQIVPLTSPMRSRTLGFIADSFFTQTLKKSLLGGTEPVRVGVKMTLAREGRTEEREWPLSLDQRDGRLGQAFYTFDFNEIFSDSGLESVDDNLSFITVEFLGNEIFRTIQPPTAIWSHHLYDEGHALFTPTAAKFSVRRVMLMAQGLQQLVEYHPAVYVSRSKNVDSSLLVMNPYPGKIRYDIRCSASSRLFSQAIAPMTAQQVTLSAAFPDVAEANPMTVMISSRNRLCLYGVTHPYAEPLRLQSLDHLDQYRAYPLYQPWSQVMRRELAKAIGR